MATMIIGRFLQRSFRSAFRAAARRYSKDGKPKVYLTRKLDEAAMKYLAKHCELVSYKGAGAVPREELLQNIPEADGLLCLLTDKIDQEVLDTGSKLKVISTMSVGFDHMDVPAIRAKNIRIGYTPGILTDATAELTLALTLAVGRRIIESSEEAACGGWSTWSPYWMCGQGLKGMTVGIVGLGAIGAAVMARICPFRPKEFLYVNKKANAECEEQFNAKMVSLDELLAASDFVICNIALTPETNEMFNAETFGKMKPNAIFINTARGGVVNQDALIDALQKKCIAGAGLDVTMPEPLPLDSPLLKMKNCVILPHIGSATHQTRNGMAMLAVKNLINGLKGEDMPEELKK